jgi:ubiquinone/menaquinone biosynthesis C-methylase UbiE
MAQAQPQKTAAPGVETLIQMHWAGMASRALSSAVQLRVFSHIAAGHTTSKEIARAAGASERGIRMLLNALVGYEFLSKSGDRYGLTPLASEYLVQDSPNYMGHIMEIGDLMELPWEHLTETIRTGRPFHRVEEQGMAEQFFPRLVRSLHVLNREPARSAAQALCGSDSRSDMQVVDLGCGSGVWGIAIAEANPLARITAQDFPGMLDVTREFVKRHGVAERYDFLAGDVKHLHLGQNRFDLAILGNVVHSEGEQSSRDLFKRVFRAMRSRGKIAIIDMIPNDDRTGPAYPLLFALNMLVHTEAGDTYTLPEYTAWLNEAGFRRVETADIGSPSPMIVGTKD